MTRKRCRMLGIAFATLALLTIAVAVASPWIAAGFGSYCVVWCGAFAAYAEWPKLDDFGIGFINPIFPLSARVATLLGPPRVDFGKPGSAWVSVPCRIPTLLFAVVAALLWRASRPDAPSGHCAACGYNLTGNVSGQCPECGAKIEPT